MSGHARFEVKRGDLAAGGWRDVPDAALAPGEARLAVRLYSLTSNNITYGLMGEGMGYWDFFPAPEGFGAIPVWGFAEVVESLSPEVKVGERFYGYLPMGDRFVVQVGAARADGFTDVAAHRAKRAPVYNRYVRASADPLYDAAREAEIALFRPLFATSFVLDFYLANSDFFGAEQVILASASSKTALATAFMLSRRTGKRPEIVGLTSPANRGFCERLGFYDRIVAYEDVTALDASRPTAFVDMAGAGAVQRAVHAHFGEKLAHSLVVGVTHYAEAGGPPPPGTKQTMFFAPDQFRVAADAWGAQEFDRRMKEAWIAFTASAEAWLNLSKAHTRAEITAMYQEVLASKTPPERGNIVIPQS